MLSEHEKARLREEEKFRHEIRKELDDKHGSFWNSPFVVTFLGGVFLAFISGGVTECTARHTKDRELASQRLRQKQDFVETFNTKIERYLELSVSVRKRELFLREWQSDPKRATVRYPDGRTFEETRTKWEEDKKFWLEHSPGSATGLVYTAVILFSGRDLREKLMSLERAVETYERAQTNEQLTHAYDQVITQLQEASLAMAGKLYEN